MVPIQALGKSGGLGGIYGSVIALLWGPGSGNNPLRLHFSVLKRENSPMQQLFVRCTESTDKRKIFILTDKSCDLFSYLQPPPLSFLAVC